jgi:hypothetical protein
VNGRERQRRREARRLRRIPVRYGAKEPSFPAIAMQLSTRGLFLSTNSVVYAQGSAIVVEVRGPAGVWVAGAVVRHAVKVHPNLARFTKPGMGVELLDAPEALRAYLKSL